MPSRDHNRPLAPQQRAQLVRALDPPADRRRVDAHVDPDEPTNDPVRESVFGGGRTHTDFILTVRRHTSAHRNTVQGEGALPRPTCILRVAIRAKRGIYLPDLVRTINGPDHRSCNH